MPPGAVLLLHDEPLRECSVGWHGARIKEKEKGSILGGILTVVTVLAFSIYVLTLLSNFFAPNNNDDYSVLQNLQEPL